MKRYGEWGLVYIFKCERLYKIGYTNDSVRARLNTVQTGNPYKVTLLYEIPSPEPHKTEADIKFFFRERHVRGEWYRLLKSDLVTVWQIAREHQQLHMDYQTKRAQERIDNGGW